jgi:signal transduction histidine kinase/ActR/RegA family two-component response regulator
MASTLLTSTSVLVFTCAGFFAHEYFTFRKAMASQLATVAGIIADNSTAVLAFQDRAGAGEILGALEADPHIVAAALYDAEGRLFSTYPEAIPAADLPAAPEGDGYRFIPSYLAGFHPVAEGGKRLGTLYLRSDMRAITARLKLYGLVAFLVAAAAILLSYALSTALQRQISGPILELAETARRVSEHRDYSVRAGRAGTGEIAVLTEAFNHMLTRIQDQLARMQLLNNITHAIGERLDLPSIFQVLSNTLEEKFPLDFTCICLYDSAAATLKVSNVGTRSAPLAASLGMEEGKGLPIDHEGMSRCVRGELIHEPDLAGAASAFPERLSSLGLRSLVLAPLLFENNVFGILVAARRDPGRFSSLDCEFLSQLSAHAALASHQALLYGEIQRAYEELRQSQQAILQQERLRALGQMASGIAHDINNAISPVALYTEFLLESEPTLSPRARKQLQTISRAIDDVAATVARMREFYRQRDSDAHLSPVQLNGCAQQVIELTRARWSDMSQQRGHTIEIRTDLAEDLPDVLSVEGEVREALTNLYLNAFDAMPEGGTLTVRTRMSGTSAVCLEVSDTGMGMDEETRKRCLEPFYTTKGERGSGLGLPMVYGMVERHGASIEIDSAPGRGTTIRILFDARVGAAAPSGDAPAGPVGPLALLVVDDDPLLLKSLEDALAGDGHAVTAANGGRAGVDAFRDALASGRAFDLVITDLGMPYLDGRKVAAAIKESSPSTPVLLLTGWGQRLIAEEDVPAHVDCVLSKPPRLAHLREAFAALVAGRGTGRAPGPSAGRGKTAA